MSRSRSYVPLQPHSRQSTLAHLGRLAKKHGEAVHIDWSTGKQQASIGPKTHEAYARELQRNHAPTAEEKTSTPAKKTAKKAAKRRRKTTSSDEGTG